MNAMRAVFPGAAIFGCFFHLVRSMKRQLAEKRLLAQCRNDSTLQHTARMIIALAFLPRDIVQATFDQLASESPDVLEPVLNWFERTYVGCRNRRGVRRAPLFHLELWSVHERILMGRDHTNNFVEAAHRRMKLEHGADHSTLLRFIEGIRKVQAG
uniref:MULE transposase domain-containing protein n=1 Tax=Trichuris muris TaxID=70415 RepID=A0A5S6QCC4_TRIMR